MASAVAWLTAPCPSAKATDAWLLVFGGVGIGYPALLEPSGAAGNFGDGSGNKAASTGFGAAHRPALSF